ncbi:MAG: winged helix-turn-helix domain-containing protein [Planctomycetaceae bacterium]|nr:winged helix-turn-helix domain-containing protein [Planctomycetaceae bacterium]
MAATKTAATPKTALFDVTRIGQTAGAVWQALSTDGPMTVAKLIKAVDEPRDTVMQAIGWLAREDKVFFAKDGRTQTVSLTPTEG